MSDLQCMVPDPFSCHASWLQDWELTHAIVSFEGWMYPLLIGKGGGRIKELEKTLGTQLTVDREAGLIKVCCVICWCFVG